MPKSYAQYFSLFRETQYDSNVFPLLKLSALNKGVNFVTVPSQHGQSMGSNPQIMVQRLKRIKGKESPVDLTVDSKFGSNFIKQLDQASYLDWETLSTQRGTMKQIAIVQPKNSSYDIESVDEAFGRAIEFATTNTLVAAEEAALTKVWGAATLASATPLDLSTLSTLTDVERRAIVDNIFMAVFKIQHLVDDFKAYSSNVVVLIHPVVSYVFEQLHGTTYRFSQNDDSFTQGAGKSFEYNGVTFIVDALLNFLPGATSGTAAGAIVMDTEAYCNSGFGTADDILAFSEVFLGDTITGHKYSYLDIVLDPARIIKFEVKLPSTNPISTPVNA